MIAVPSPTVSEHVLEVRFAPSAKILDRRGDWADILTSTLGLPEWQVVENRLDVLTKDRSRHAFVSFRNMGYIAQDTQNPNQHRDWARGALKAVFKLPGFPSKLHVERFGLRGRFCVPYSGSFDSLRDAVVQRYVAPSSDLVAAFGNDAKLLDIGAPLNFSDSLGNFNTHCGPMTDGQLRKFFKKRSDLPEVAFYFDVDYWQEPKAALDAHDLGKLVESYSTAAWSRFKQAANIVLVGSAASAVARTNGS